MKYGYETPEAFTKAFKKYHGFSPIECRKTHAYKYQERSFPLAVKMKTMEGANKMTNFGSPLKQIIDDLDNSSRNMYYCFSYKNERYAIKAIDVEEIHSLQGLYLNTKKEYCLFFRGARIPVVQINGIADIKDSAIGRYNILIFVPKQKNNSNKSPNSDLFGLIIEGNPELKIVSSINEYINFERPYVSSIGKFDDEQTQIITTHEFYDYIKNQLAATFDEAEKFSFANYTGELDIIKRLEYAAYDAELLARNASIEAVHGMQMHKGTMVVAYELHQHAVEIAKIAHDLRERLPLLLNN